MAKKKSEAKTIKLIKKELNITEHWLFWVVVGVIVLALMMIWWKNSLSRPYLQQKKLIARITKSSPVATDSAKIASSSATATKSAEQVAYQPQSGYQIPILMYHYIGNNPNPADKARDSLSVPPDKFQDQMDYLAKSGYTPITLDTLYGIFNKQVSPPNKPIVLTFDDGYIDFYINAFPILRRFNFHAVSFIPTGLIGSSYYMHWDQIKEIQASGLVAFEAHTITHVNLPTLSYEAALKQMLDSKNILAAQTGYPVNFIAYPYGTTDNSVEAGAKAAGFTGALGTWSGIATGNSFDMPRIRISGYWSVSDFAARI